VLELSYEGLIFLIVALYNRVDLTTGISGAACDIGVNTKLDSRPPPFAIGMIERSLYHIHLINKSKGRARITALSFIRLLVITSRHLIPSK